MDGRSSPGSCFNRGRDLSDVCIQIYGKCDAGALVLYVWTKGGATLPQLTENVNAGHDQNSQGGYSRVAVHNHGFPYHSTSWVQRLNLFDHRLSRTTKKKQKNKFFHGSQAETKQQKAQQEKILLAVTESTR